MKLFGLYLYHDLRRDDTDETVVTAEVVSNSHTSTTYFLLLSGSIVICTLGLLIDSAAVVIGGMIIAPLMWPVMKTALSISYERPGLLREGLITIGFSTVTAICFAYGITIFSPLKTVTEQILLRSNPTPVDLIIAIVAGAVAALAILRPKIATSLGGVAVTASLVPPLCVVGIGLALKNMTLAMNSLLLYLSNIEAMVFAGLLVFYLAGVRRQSDETHLKRSGGMALLTLIVLTIIPLYTIFSNYVFENTAYTTVEQVLSDNLNQISNQIVLSQLKTEISRVAGERTVVVHAELLVPSTVALTDDARQDLLASLEKELGANTRLELQVQSLISLKSNEDLALDQERNTLLSALRQSLTELGQENTIDSIDARSTPEGEWVLSSVLFVSENLDFSLEDRDAIERALATLTTRPLTLELALIPRRQFLAESDARQQFQRDLRRLFELRATPVLVEIRSLAIDEALIHANLGLTLLDGAQVADLPLEDIRQTLEAQYQRPVELSVVVLQAQQLNLSSEWPDRESPDRVQPILN